MTVWTIQSRVVVDLLKSDLVLAADDGRLQRASPVPEQYRWLTDQMRVRLPNFQGHLPWWFHREKPDLRAFRHCLPENAEYVRLQVEVSESDALCFPSWAWDRIMRLDYLAFDEEDDLQFRHELEDSDVRVEWADDLFVERAMASWPRLFDARLKTYDWEPQALNHKVECVCEWLWWSGVREMKSFRGTSKIMKAWFVAKHEDGTAACVDGKC